jgi:HTH-type transcriptional regulator, competence development regulator
LTDEAATAQNDGFVANRLEDQVMARHGERGDPENTLGAHLAQLRKAAGLSLRQVEEQTDKEVSNAYLSQLENDKIAKPSPNILEVLAKTYKTSYEDLMRRAGYMSSDADLSGRRRGRVATFAVGELTAEEEKALLDYLAFIRQKRK